MKTKFLLPVVAGMLFCGTFSSCKKDDNTTPDDTGNVTDNANDTLCNGIASTHLIPLGETYKWTYSSTGFLSSDATFALDGEDGTFERDGITWYDQTGSLFDWGFMLDFIGYDAEGNLRHRESTFSSMDTSEVFIPATLAVGTTWNLNLYKGFFEGTMDSLVVKSMSETLELESCTYSDLVKIDVFNTNDQSRSHQMYLKKGLGVVKMISHDANFGTETDELKEVRLN